MFFFFFYLILYYLNSEGKDCLKYWEGHFQIDNSAHAISKFFRQNFLRSYYNNRAPYVINLESSWLQKFEAGQKEPMSKRRKTSKISKRIYKNLDGVIKFVNETLLNNKDVYFVTAYQAIKWTQSLQYISDNHEYIANLTEFFHKQILNGDENVYDCSKANYNGKCDYLKLKTLDYNKTKGMKDESENDEIENANLLVDYQSELLFLDSFTSYLTIIFIFCLIAIFMYDKIY